MIKMDISGTAVAIRHQDKLTCGMIGAQVEFRFDEDWEALSKTAVFRAGDVVKDVILTDTTAVIPWETLVTPGVPLEIGVYGYTLDEDGTVQKAKPTLWARTAAIHAGADPSGDESAANPTAEVYEQAVAASQLAIQAAETATDAAEQAAVACKELDATLSEQKNNITTKRLKLYDADTKDEPEVDLIPKKHHGDEDLNVLYLYGSAANASVEEVILRNLYPGAEATDAVTVSQLDAAVGDIESALDAILAIQEALIGGDGV